MTLWVLPPEIWRQIVKDNLHSKHDWLALSRASSLFFSIAQEALYSDISLKRCSSDEVDGGRAGARTLELFTRSVKERPKLATLVRHLRVTYVYEWDPNSEEEQRMLLDTYTSHPVLSNLGWFSMLCHLYLEGFLIDPMLVSALKAHIRLASIEFRNCDVSETLLCTDSSQNWSETSISTVSIKCLQGSTNVKPWVAVCPATMQSIRFDDHDPVVVDGVFSNLLLLGVTTSLTRLSVISYDFPPNLIRCLTGTPQLRRLKLPYIIVDTETHPLHAIQREIIPFLEHFKGPADLCRIFVPGRPVHSLKLKFRDDTPADILLVLQLSAVPVTKLRFYHVLRPESRHYEYLMHSPISIRSFGWDGVMSSEESHVLYRQALSRLTNLVVVAMHLSWTLSDYGLSHGKKIVYEYSKACPLLQEVNFKMERWLLRKHGGWECLQVRSMDCGRSG